MKSAKSFAVILLFVSFSFTNCSPDQDHLFTTNEIITRGNWGVEFFVNQNKTAEYGNYVFTFAGNGTMESSNGTDITQGTWTVIRDADRSDLLTISFGDQNNITELNNSWSVKARSTSALQLQAKGNTTEFRIRKL